MTLSCATTCFAPSTCDAMKKNDTVRIHITLEVHQGHAAMSPGNFQPWAQTHIDHLCHGLINQLGWDEDAYEAKLVLFVKKRSGSKCSLVFDIFPKDVDVEVRDLIHQQFWRPIHNVRKVANVAFGSRSHEHDHKISRRLMKTFYRFTQKRPYYLDMTEIPRRKPKEVHPAGDEDMTEERPED